MSGLRAIAILAVTVILLASQLAEGHSLNNSLDTVWQTFNRKHDKVYSSKEEEQFRRGVWEAHVVGIEKHNLKYDLGLFSFTMGIHEYSDLTFVEYRKYLLGARQELSTREGSSSRIVYHSDVPVSALPDTVDWRTKGYVTPIKNQGQCGSCWAFSSTGALEGQHFHRTGRLIPLSEQNLVDCCKTNAGCNGGWMDNAFNYVKTNGGIDTEAYYPYQTKESGRCSYNPNDSGATCCGLVDIDKANETALQQAVATVGPIAVGIDATHQSFMDYKSGIYFEAACSTTVTDHAVLVVGYGTSAEGQAYWLVKNSWGTSWGMDGYIQMARNKDNMCAIASFASYPIV